MYGTADYLSAALLVLVGIAAFVNLTRGTFVEWLQAKFLGRSAGKSTPTTPFTPTKAAA